MKKSITVCVIKMDAVYALLQNKNMNIEKLNDMDYVDSFLREILGQEYHDFYDINLAEQWNHCLRNIILQPKFIELYKLFEFDKVEKLENIVNNHVRSKLLPVKGEWNRIK